MADILHRVGIKASRAKVYEALSSQKGLAGWWPRHTKATPEAGAVNEFRFGELGFNHMKITELTPGTRVRWICVDGAQEWIGTDVSFDLKQQNGLTILLFAQRGWKDPVEFMHYCSTKWARYLLSLKALCETGAGTPYPG
jgi:uncharacterized protein YndB with AHSA1/START domain